MTEEWRKAIRYRNRLWKLFTGNRTDNNYELYKAERNTCTSLRRKAIREFFSKKAQADNPWEFWKTYQPFLHYRNSKQANDIILIEKDTVFTDKCQIAVLFNEHFVYIADGVGEIEEREHGNNFSNHPSIKNIRMNNGMKQDSDRVLFYPTNKTKVEDLLSNIDIRKACGHDMLLPRLIKESSDAIAGPVTKILNTAIVQGRYPSKWKMGQVTPVFKKDDETDKRNYRPVTVLPCLNNIFERLLSIQLQEFYQGLLSNYISAYRHTTAVKHHCSA